MLQQLQSLDDRLFLWINHAAADSVVGVVFAWLNRGAPFFLLSMAALGWLAYRNSRRHGLVLVVLLAGLVLGDTLVFNPLKHAAGRPRPATRLVETRALVSGATGGHAFPSSHTANAFLAAALLAAFFRRSAAGWFACASLVGISRIGVGVHYPSDVVGSALLGSLVGWIEAEALRRLRPSLFSDRQAGDARASTRPDPLASAGAWLSARRWPAAAALMAIQFARLAWAAGTLLDVPPGCARLVWLADQPGSFPGALARGWFALFGSSPLSLWMIPWFLQTAWLAALWYFCGRSPRPKTGAGEPDRRISVRRTWSVVLLAGILPMASQLSFLGSPAQIFDDSNWGAGLRFQALCGYLLLGLPVWAMALARLRSHPLACGIAWGGLVLGVGFPSVPWFCVALAASGVLPLLGDWMLETWSAWQAAARGWSRLSFAALVLYGLPASAAVYNPRVLRKLDFSFLPRNNPQYVQTGWREWADRIRPRMQSQTGIREVWADSPLSRDQLQYWLGKEFRVRSLTDLEGGDFAAKWERAIRSSGAFYVREVYFNRINPEVIFVGRRDSWFPPVVRRRMREVDSTEIQRKGDPIRQLQLYFLSPSPAG